MGDTQGGSGAEASAIYRIGQTLDLRIGGGGAAPGGEFVAGGGGPALLISKSAIPVSPSCSWLAAAAGAAFDNTFEASEKGGDGKTTSTDPGANGKGLGGGGEEDIPRMVNLSCLVAKAAQACRVAERPGNSNRREDLAAAAEAPRVTTSPRVMGAGVGARLMAEMGASTYLARRRISPHRKAALHL